MTLILGTFYIWSPSFILLLFSVIGPYFNGLKRKWEAPRARSFVGGSMAMSLFYRRKKWLLRPAQIEKELVWSSLITRRCGLGVSCNKPMRVPAPIPFKSHEHIWIWRVDILTARLQSPMRQMHMNFKLQMAQFMAKQYGLIHTWNKVFFQNFRNTESSNTFRQRKCIWSNIWYAVTVVLFNDIRNTL
jgi:hypothetical protein